MIAPALLAWWLWPVSRAVRVGLHSAVVWKRLYLRPPAASFSSVGMRIGPPKALLWPKPMSSISTITTLGAPCGRLHLEARRRLRLARVELGDRLVHGLRDRQHASRFSAALWVWASAGTAQHSASMAIAARFILGFLPSRVESRCATSGCMDRCRAARSGDSYRQ